MDILFARSLWDPPFPTGDLLLAMVLYGLAFSIPHLTDCRDQPDDGLPQDQQWKRILTVAVLTVSGVIYLYLQACGFPIPPAIAIALLLFAGNTRGQSPERIAIYSLALTFAGFGLAALVHGLPGMVETHDHIAAGDGWQTRLSGFSAALTTIASFFQVGSGPIFDGVIHPAQEWPGGLLAAMIFVVLFRQSWRLRRRLPHICSAFGALLLSALWISPVINPQHQPLGQLPRLVLLPIVIVVGANILGCCFRSVRFSPKVIHRVAGACGFAIPLLIAASFIFQTTQWIIYQKFPLSAIPLLEEICRANPDNFAAVTRLAQLSARSGDLKRAEDLVLFVESYAYFHPQLHVAKAEVLALQGNADAARRVLQDLLARKPLSPTNTRQIQAIVSSLEPD